jgi:hypothetical protein
VGDLEGFYGHTEYDAQQELFQDEEGNFPKINGKADFMLGNSKIFVNGLLKK